MKKMPKSFENKLRMYNKKIVDAAMLDKEIQEHLEKKSVPYDHLIAWVDSYENKEPVTEALAYINNAECRTQESLDDSIERIRTVYEYFINKDR